MALTILVLGVTMISNYDKMKDMEMQISDMAKGTEGVVEANASAKEEARGKKDAETEKFTNGLSQTEVPDGNQETRKRQKAESRETPRQIIYLVWQTCRMGQMRLQHREPIWHPCLTREAGWAWHLQRELEQI